MRYIYTEKGAARKRDLGFDVQAGDVLPDVYGPVTIRAFWKKGYIEIQEEEG